MWRPSGSDVCLGKGGWQWRCREQPEESFFPVVPDVLWIELDNSAGLNGRRALASLIVLVASTLPDWLSAPSLMELKSRSCCWLWVGGAVGSGRCFLLGKDSDQASWGFVWDMEQSPSARLWAGLGWE